MDSWNAGSAPAASLGCWVTGGHPTAVAWPTRSPTRSGCWCSTGGSGCRPGSRPSASWRPRCRSAGPRWRAAYEALRAARVLHSRRGAGSWTQLPPELAGGGRVSPFFPLGSGPGGTDGLFDLAHAALPRPAAELRRAAAAAVLDLDAHLGGHGYELLGLPALRAAIADRFTARGLPTAAGPDPGHRGGPARRSRSR